MNARYGLHGAALLALSLTAACGDGHLVTDGGAGLDMAPDSAVPYPAPHPATPTVQSNGGTVVANPKLVAITFSGDSLQSSIDDFTSKLAASAYWGGTTAEYGVGKASALPPVHLSSTAPTTIDDFQIHQLLTSQIKNTAGFPQPDADTIYMLYFPDTTTIKTLFGDSCKGFQGYHDDYKLAAGQFVTYVALGRCPPPVSSVTVLDNLTATASHEAIEAATDPLPTDNAAFNVIDDDHVAWAFLGGGAELGDVCAAFPTVFYHPTDLPYLVQRTWSNKAAAAGHDPCEPDGAKPYFNAAPVLTDSIDVPSPTGFGSVTTKGLKIPVGQSATVEVDLFSDAPTSGPWTVKGVDLGSAFKGTAPYLSFSFDKATGQNGDKLMMTVTALKANPSGVSLYWIESDLGMAQSVWLGMVVNN